MMFKKAAKTAQRISVDDIATMAAEARERACEARQAAGIALSAEELANVNGGLAAWIINGGYPLPILANQFGAPNQLGGLAAGNVIAR